MYQVRLLKREVESIVDKAQWSIAGFKFDEAVTIRFHVPGTSERLPMRYIPVSDELKRIAERMGDYLHSTDTAKLLKSRFWTDFAALIDRGIALLSDAVSGDLLVPPMWQKKGSSGIIIAFDCGKTPKFLTAGASLKFDVTLRVVSKDTKMMILKNA
jgi:hypothetical protein